MSKEVLLQKVHPLNSCKVSEADVLAGVESYYGCSVFCLVMGFCLVGFCHVHSLDRT